MNGPDSPFLLFSLDTFVSLRFVVFGLANGRYISVRDASGPESCARTEKNVRGHSRSFTSCDVEGHCDDSMDHMSATVEIPCPKLSPKVPVLYDCLFTYYHCLCLCLFVVLSLGWFRFLQRSKNTLQLSGLLVVCLSSGNTV